MIAGHFGFAAIVKSRARQAPLWALMLAAVWLDIVFVPFLLAGIETLEPVAGTRGGYGANIIHADYTHSFVGAVALAALFGLACAIPWGRPTGLVLGAVAFSHWLLDLPVHRADLPLLPANLGELANAGFRSVAVPACGDRNRIRSWGQPEVMRRFGFPRWTQPKNAPLIAECDQVSGCTPDSPHRS